MSQPETRQPERNLPEADPPEAGPPGAGGSGQWDIVSGVGITALGVAAARAVESSRPDRLVHDPYAAGFVAAAGLPMRVPVQWPENGTDLSEPAAMVIRDSTFTGLRTRLFDDLLAEATRTGLVQFVLLAAGLDTRAYRLSWPSGTRVYELDQPRVLEFKERVLREAGAEARCTRRPVPVDLRDDWPAALRSAGFDPGTPTGWLAEGLLPYLSPETEARLLVHIHDLSTVDSRLGLDRTTDASGILRDGGLDALRGGDVDMTALVDATQRPTPATLLAAHDWSVTEETAQAAAGRYQRTLIDPRLRDLPGDETHVAEFTSFVTARRAL
jgi:methyltransferase (TIGR00027 family)